MPLELVNESRPVTYNFKDSSGWGWASTTLNEDTGELTINSDWGAWTYRWGAPGMSLHRFVGGGDYRYLAEKLLRRSLVAFSERRTRRRLRNAIAEGHRDGSFSREDALQMLRDRDQVQFQSAQLFLHTIMGVSSFAAAFSDPVWLLDTELTPDARVLMEILLPPICDLCAKKADGIERDLKEHLCTIQPSLKS